MDKSHAFQLTAIGFARTPWSKGDCPHNMTQARQRGGSARVEVLEAFRPALLGLERASHLMLLGWLAEASRERLVQQPRHLACPLGAFALRSPDRPNPIALSIVRLLSADLATGIVEVDALDWFDGTPVVDIKPYFAGTDAVPEAVTREFDGKGQEALGITKP